MRPPPEGRRLTTPRSQINHLFETGNVRPRTKYLQIDVTTVESIKIPIRASSFINMHLHSSLVRWNGNGEKNGNKISTRVYDIYSGEFSTIFILFTLSEYLNISFKRRPFLRWGTKTIYKAFDRFMWRHI